MLTESQHAIEVLSILNFAIIGLSHILHRDAWAEFFMHLQKLGKTGVFANGFLSLIGGAIIVSFHNVWVGIPMALTIVGWLYIVKAIVCFVFPNLSLKSLARVRADNTHIFIAPGAIMLLLAVALAYNLWL